MDPQQEPFRRPHNWTILQALEQLSPPSPSPSGSFGALATLATSGEIPIFLHSSCEEDESPSASPSRPQLINLLKPSSSLATFHSTNTFGVSRPATSQANDLDSATPDDASDRTARCLSTSVRSSDSTHLSAKPSRDGGYWNNRFSSVSDISTASVSTVYMDYYASSDQLSSHFRSDSGVLQPTLSVKPSVSPSEPSAAAPLDHSPHSPYPAQAVFHAFRFPPPAVSASPSLTSRPAPDTPTRSWSLAFFRRSPSPSPSITSTAICENLTTTPPARLRSTLLRKTLKSRSPSVQSDLSLSGGLTPRSSSPQLLAGRLCDSVPVSPTSPRFALQDSDSPTLAETETDNPGIGHSQLGSANQALADLPEVVGWLRDIRIELWIDQEGFRRIRPKFRLVSYTSSLSPSCPASNDLVEALTYGVALFRPVQRVTSTYHHGTLDALPVLRRLTLANSEDKDYISRQASLTIKSNGIYAVTGTESFEDPLFTSGGLAQVAGNILNLGSEQAKPLQLQWRFEYFVEDKKSHRGTLMPGEKTLTPLSFSCSPALLHPSHGKRIRLMHVLMKTITPNLSAAPLTTQNPIGIVDAQSSQEHCKDDTLWPLPNPRVKNLIRTLSGHRRTRSSEPSSVPWSPAQGILEDARLRPASVSDATRQPPVVEDQGSGMTVQQSNGGDHPPSRGRIVINSVTSATPGRLSRQILTREELAAILASFPNPSDTSSAAVLMTPSLNALSPPSYYLHRRAQSDLERADEFGRVHAT